MKIGHKLILAGYAGLVLPNIVPAMEIVSGLASAFLCLIGTWILLHDDDGGDKLPVHLEVKSACNDVEAHHVLLILRAK